MSPTTIDLPVGGRSLPVVITANTGVSELVLANLNQKGTLPTNIQINPDTLVFFPGDTYKSFYLTSSAYTIGTSGIISFSLTPDSASLFAIGSGTLDLQFRVRAADHKKPNIISSSFTASTRTTAQLSIQTDETVLIYYLCSQPLLNLPTFSEIFNQKLTMVYQLAANQQFGVNYQATSANSFVYNIKVTGLKAGTSYNFIGYVQDLGYNLASTVLKFSFQTVPENPLYKAAITLTTLTNSATIQTQKQNFIQSLALSLFIDSSRLVEDLSSITTTMNLVIIPDSTAENDNSPQSYAIQICNTLAQFLVTNTFTFIAIPVICQPSGYSVPTPQIAQPPLA